MLAVGRAPHYIYLPEIADDPRQAQTHGQTDIEIVRDMPTRLAIQCAIFDHDGTISTLRQGWEEVMEPMMVRAVLGDHFDHADEAVYRKVVDQVRRFIDQTTGVQTLVQMQGLVELVRRMGFVPEEEILDMHGYKTIYNEALMTRVRDRLHRLERGELGVQDFTIKNAVAFLHALRASGITCYLASGTDEADVCGEAEALGYADAFDGGIYGAAGDVTHDAKQIVLERILARIGSVEGRLVTFGDGPVEMRETHRRGGLAVGVASDEVRRFGLNPAKRARLIRAGASLIVPDFSQMDDLLGFLGVH
jgi:phosphoglycolate phosphatase-like HAD superfamily hydrolase